MYHPCITFPPSPMKKSDSPSDSLPLPRGLSCALIRAIFPSSVFIYSVGLQSCQYTVWPRPSIRQGGLIAPVKSKFASRFSTSNPYEIVRQVVIIGYGADHVRSFG
jgi:hypothetical protein